METFKTSLTLILTLGLGLAIVIPLQAQNTPRDYLAVHNAARAAVGVGPMRWDNRLEIYARNYADRRKRDCRLVHSGGPYGENIAWSSGDMSGVGAVRLWVNEKQYYRYNANKCREGKVCGHYTQVVWRKSVWLGCAKTRCNNGGTFIICSYRPRGNIRGQKPY